MMTDEQIKYMVNRFLVWQDSAKNYPDGVIAKAGVEAMVRFMIEGMPTYKVYRRSEMLKSKGHPHSRDENIGLVLVETLEDLVQVFRGTPDEVIKP